MRADQACSFPFRQALMRRPSFHVTSGSRSRRVRRVLPSSSRRTGGPPAPEQLLDVPKRVMVENGRPQIAQSLCRTGEHARTDEADDGQILRDQFLHAVVQTLAQLDIAHPELL